MLGSAVQIFRRAARGVQTSLGHSALLTLTLWAALLTVGLFAVALHNLQAVVGRWGQAGQLGITLDAAAPRPAWEQAQRSLAALPGVQGATLIGPEAALRRFAARGAAARALVEGVEAQLLPPLVEMQIDLSRTDLAALVARAEALPTVVRVDVGLEELAALRSLFELLRLGSLTFGGAVLLAAALICANTLRLVLHGQADEIALLRLVGGTPRFVRAPYILQGMFFGALASLLADASLFALHRQIGPRLSAAAAAFTGQVPVRLFDASVGLGLLACGLGLGALGSALAVQRHLHAELR